MKHRLHLLILSSSLLFVGSSWAVTEDSKTVTAKNEALVESTEKTEAQAKQRKPTPRRLTGSILEVNRIKSEDGSAHTVSLVVAVTLDKRYTMPLAVVDTGDEFKLGDAVSVAGMLAASDGEVMFTPVSISTNGNTKLVINKDPVKLNEAAANTEAAVVEPDRIKGQLDWYQNVTIQGLDEKDEVIRVNMADGTSDIIHLGVGPKEFKLGLEQGEMIEVVGENKLINGKQILFAKEFYVDGVQKL